MRVSWKKSDEIRYLCRHMVKRCDEYQMLRNTPDSELRAAEIREDIMRLYANISILQRGMAIPAPMHPGTIAQGGSRAQFCPSEAEFSYP